MKHKPPEPMNLADAVALIAKQNSVTPDGTTPDEQLSDIIQKTGYTAVFSTRTFSDVKEKAMSVAQATGCSGLLSVITD